MTTEPDSDASAPTAAPASRRTAATRDNGPVPFLLLLNLVAVVLFAVAGIVYVVHDSDGGGGGGGASAEVFEYTVPPGTGRALDQGKNVDFFPARLDVRVGDQLVIHNDDNRGHTVGPYFVNRGETLRQTFTAPGEIKGICTIHPSGAVTILVT